MHEFYTKTYDGRGWMVKCHETGGEFSTLIWDGEYHKKNVCPCCNQVIKNEH